MEDPYAWTAQNGDTLVCLQEEIGIFTTAIGEAIPRSESGIKTNIPNAFRAEELKICLAMPERPVPTDMACAGWGGRGIFAGQACSQ